MKILIIRHGEPDYANDCLTDEGKIQAELLGERLSKVNIRHIYSSPLGRAYLTAVPTATLLGLEIDVRDWLREVPVGIKPPYSERHICPWEIRAEYWTPKNEFMHKSTQFDDICFADSALAAHYDMVGEQLAKLLAEMGLFRDGYLYDCPENTEDTYAIFCHQGLGLELLSHLLPVPFTVMEQAFFLPTSSVTTLITEERDKGKVFLRCKSLGDTSHLYAGGRNISTWGHFSEIHRKK